MFVKRGRDCPKKVVEVDAQDGDLVALADSNCQGVLETTGLFYLRGEGML
jgi:hypothetical protein